MAADDLTGVMALADCVHRGLPESEAVFCDRLHLYPCGCLVLSDGTGCVAGYAIGHPWREGTPPKLDTVLGALPEPRDCFHIHDVVVAPEARGVGHSRAVVERLLRLAADFPFASLVSVHGTHPFWSRFGFRDVSESLPADALDAYGPGPRFMRRTNRERP